MVRRKWVPSAVAAGTSTVAALALVPALAQSGAPVPDVAAAAAAPQSGSRAAAKVPAAAQPAGSGGATSGNQAVAAAPATNAAAPSVRITALEIDATVGPASDRHTCTVAADLYVPSTAGPRNRVPAILTTNGFGGSKADQAGIGQAAAQQGYVVLSYSGLGFGGSDCKIYIDDPQYDGLAGRQLVDFLAGRKRANDGTKLDVVKLDRPGDPRIGLIGGSYGGQSQFAVMAADRRLDALIPLVTWNDLAYSLAPNNTAFQTGVSTPAPGVFKRWWAALFTTVGVLRGAEHAPSDPSRLEGCPNFRQDVCGSLAQLAVLGYPDDATYAWTRGVSVASYIDKVTAPTLLMQGQADTLFNLQEAAATYRALERRRVPVRMIWQAFGHSGTGPTGELDLSPAGVKNSYLGRRALGWFDYWLKGDRRASLGPKFAYYRDWAYRNPGDGAGPGAQLAAVTKAYGTASGYPVAGSQPLYLSGDGSLVPWKSAVTPGGQSYVSPPVLPSSYSETSAVQAAFGDQPPPLDAPGTFAAWTTAPLARDVDTIGVPTLDVQLDSPIAGAAQSGDPAGRLVLFAKLYDVAPDGSQSLKYRLVSPVRVPDVTRVVRIELPGIVHRWQKGHRIKLVLAGSDWAYTGNLVAQPVTITTDPAKPAVLRLPVLRQRVG